MPLPYRDPFTDIPLSAPVRLRSRHSPVFATFSLLLAFGHEIAMHPRLAGFASISSNCPSSSFGTMTAHLLKLAEWLREHGVAHVAMEATGVVWRPVWAVRSSRFPPAVAVQRSYTPVDVFLMHIQPSETPMRATKHQ